MDVAMNRRGFLATLFGSATAAVLLPKIDLLTAHVQLSRSQLEAAKWWDTYRLSLAEARRLFESEMSKRGTTITPQDIDALGLLGLTTSEGILLTCQKSIAIADTDPERCLIPAMFAMADALSWQGIDRFGTLPKPHACTFAETDGPLRMIVHYDIEHDSYTTRFDVIGGASPSGKRRVVLRKAQWTKDAIRRRLGTYPSASRLPS